MNRNFKPLLGVLLLAFGMMACTGSFFEAFGFFAAATPEAIITPAGPDRSINSAQSLSEALTSAGLTVKSAGSITQPFFSVNAQILVANDEDIQVFEYADEKTAEAEAAQVDPKGSAIGTNMMSWMAPPHFYRKGNLIVLHIGRSKEVKAALEALFGPQFAGQ
jgi:hypothetical protein